MEAWKLAFTRLWTRPKETMDELVRDGGKAYIWLVLLAGIGLRLDQAANGSLGDRVATDYILVTSIVIGPVVGVIAWFVYSGLSHLMIRVFGGYGTWAETRRAFAWATVPLVVKLVLWIPQLIILGDAMFSSQTRSGIGVVAFFLLFGLLELVLIIWFFVILAKGLGEIHSIASWKGFWSVVTLPLVFVCLLVLVVLLNI